MINHNSQGDNGQRLLTVKECAERLCLKESTIRRMILQRRIETVRPSAELSGFLNPP